MQAHETYDLSAFHINHKQKVTKMLSSIKH